MPVVKLFGNLRRQTETPQLRVPGETVRAVIESLCDQTPTLREAILDGSDLRPYVRVMVAGRDVALDRGLDTPIQENDQIAVFPPLAGG